METEQYDVLVRAELQPDSVVVLVMNFEREAMSEFPDSTSSAVFSLN